MTSNTANSLPKGSAPSAPDETVRWSPLGSYTNCLIPRKDSDLKLGNGTPMPTASALDSFGIDLPRPPEAFPLDAFPAFLQDLAEDFALGCQASKSLTTMIALGIVSGAMGKSFVVQGAYKANQTQLNLYVLPVADLASGKEEVVKSLLTPLMRRSRKLADEHQDKQALGRFMKGVLQKQLKISIEQTVKTQKIDAEQLSKRLVASLAESRQHEAELERRVALAANFSTHETLARDLVHNKEIFFSYAVDATTAVENTLRKTPGGGNQGMDLLLAGYSGNEFTLRRNSTNLELQNPWLTLLWLLLPGTARKLIECKTAFDRGVLAPMLIFNTCTGREPDNRQTHEMTNLKLWEGLINNILDRRVSNSKPTIISCSVAAREIFAKFDDESIYLGNSQFADCAGQLTWWRENAIKVAGLFAPLERAKEISAELATRAIRVVRWAGYSFLGMRLAGRYESLREDLVSLEQLLRDHGGQMSVGELASSHGINRGRLNAIASTFPDRVEIEIRPQFASGRPAAVVKLVMHQAKSAEGTRLSMGQSQL